VIIIIGILAAIAIPVFLNQRKKGWDAQAKSDLKNMATAEETYLTDNGVYTGVVADLTAAGYNQSADVLGVTAATKAVASDGYDLCASSKSGDMWTYDSAAGAPVNGGAGTC
ncbi:MAG TPA: hypothetical protein VGK18_08635, partial [Propionicimonas sp.]|uniref:hypothetical protein n=1 Tax=Propionicimonas sp. TaxID=1955623 RepID=UPI002F3E6D5C